MGTRWNTGRHIGTYMCFSEVSTLDAMNDLQEEAGVLCHAPGPGHRGTEEETAEEPANEGQNKRIAAAPGVPPY